MKSQEPFVSIVIPTHNRVDMARRLIKSILEGKYKNYEIILIDDYSSDGTYKILKKEFEKKEKIKIYRNTKNLFTAATRNKGIGLSKGDFIFFIDDDNVLDKRTIAELVSAFLEDVMLGEVGPVNYNFNDKRKILWTRTIRNMFTTKTYQPRQLNGFSRKKSWDTVDIPNAFMVRASVIKKNRIRFNELFEIMYEESDFAYRIRNAGYSVKTIKNAKIYHDIESEKSNGKTKDYMYHFMENKRRPYVTARNRILFHHRYSNRFEFITIIGFWIWLFSAYYVYKILFYDGYGKFSFSRRLTLAGSYLRGDKDGIKEILSHKN